MDPNDTLRRAIDVMTAWATDNPDDTSFSGDRFMEYVSEGPDENGVDGEMKLMVGLQNLAGQLLVRLEQETGRSMQWHLQDIARKSLQQ
ncbi:hypothetical protein [Mycolicibacterium fortuitum]|uniref:Uncharacterized protein n=2 Tax=Mycolicibacterium fortuitum TaxID=1766 RepID=A0A0N9Y2E9_MYCFO|nr:hypothetical protein [Mycolicibacterium fortuitum]ALI24933.1 hypothetical protein XA26_10760 [Mycolicibacterium fortuitum]MCV7138571.1 hypothetical protein [Mycolicibacterium fortuitum]MDV7192478.1 hypothetical protein [Mycolicibacterium fortuitum]MDV7205224.1 hypothetical protein [Mycolicibacterium fortuitum]MDV7226805.1 hypothetical protein [Mycolicibacterium fortuitum]